jgi:hypothetical protein
VKGTREGAEAEARRLNGILDPRIAGHLLVYEQTLAELVRVHREIGETMEFGLGERTRWAAIWELGGRCIGLCNCLLVQARGGFASEMVPTMRAVHEAAQLLTVMSGPGEESLLVRWLDDIGYISAQQARAAERRIERPFVEEMKKRGTPLPGDQFDLGAQVYDTLSKPAHNMRVGFLESVSREQRLFSYGPHPDPIQRAVHVEFVGQQVEEVTLRFGGAFASRFLGGHFYRDVIERRLAEIRAVRETIPIDPRTVRSL